MPRPFGRNAILYSPIIRIVIGLAICLGIGLLGLQFTQFVLDKTSAPQSLKDPISGTVFAILVVALYIRLYQWYEDRRVQELSGNRAPACLLGGILLGAGLASFTILVQYFAQVYSVTATRPFGPVLPILWNTFVNATIAEVLIIGIVFRIFEDWIGSYLALAALVIIFFIIHVTTTGATPVSALGVTMHAALLLGPAYIYTRSLWAPIAIHFAWDFCLAAIFGASINGYTMDHSVFQSQSIGSSLITGGYFGPQGSIQAALLCLIAGIVFLQLSNRRGNIKPPSIRRR